MAVSNYTVRPTEHTNQGGKFDTTNMPAKHPAGKKIAADAARVNGDVALAEAEKEGALSEVGKDVAIEDTATTRANALDKLGVLGGGANMGSQQVCDSFVPLLGSGSGVVPNSALFANLERDLPAMQNSYNMLYAPSSSDAATSFVSIFLLLCSKAEQFQSTSDKFQQSLLKLNQVGLESMTTMIGMSLDLARKSAQESKEAGQQAMFSSMVSAIGSVVMAGAEIQSARKMNNLAAEQYNKDTTRVTTLDKTLQTNDAAMNTVGGIGKPGDTKLEARLSDLAKGDIKKATDSAKTLENKGKEYTKIADEAEVELRNSTKLGAVEKLNKKTDALEADIVHQENGQYKTAHMDKFKAEEADLKKLLQDRPTDLKIDPNSTAPTGLRSGQTREGLLAEMQDSDGKFDLFHTHTNPNTGAPTGTSYIVKDTVTGDYSVHHIDAQNNKYVLGKLDAASAAKLNGDPSVPGSGFYDRAKKNELYAYKHSESIEAIDGPNATKVAEIETTISRGEEVNAELKAQMGPDNERQDVDAKVFLQKNKDKLTAIETKRSAGGELTAEDTALQKRGVEAKQTRERVKAELQAKYLGKTVPEEVDVGQLRTELEGLKASRGELAAFSDNMSAGYVTVKCADAEAKGFKQYAEMMGEYRRPAYAANDRGGRVTQLVNSNKEFQRMEGQYDLARGRVFQAACTAMSGMFTMQAENLRADASVSSSFGRVFGESMMAISQAIIQMKNSGDETDRQLVQQIMETVRSAKQAMTQFAYA